MRKEKARKNLWKTEKEKSEKHDFCPRDSGPMILHITYLKILTYALKDIKSSTFEYFYMKNSPKANEILLEGKVDDFISFRAYVIIYQ